MPRFHLNQAIESLQHGPVLGMMGQAFTSAVLFENGAATSFHSAASARRRTGPPRADDCAAHRGDQR
jgi:hypothetical protein